MTCPGKLTEVLFDTALVLSLVCCAMVVVSYLRFKELRRNAFQLVLNLAVADFGLALSFFLRVRGTSMHDGPLCTIQGLVQSYFELAGPLWTAVMSFALYRTVVFRRYGTWKRSYRRYLTVAWGVPLIAALLPFAIDKHPYNVATEDENVLRWCWINGGDDKAAALRIVCYYAPLWMIIFFNLAASFSIRHHVHTMTRNSTEPSEGELALHLRKLVSRLFWYPFILLLCQAPITVVRIYPIFFLKSDVYDPNCWFELITLTLLASVGMAHSIAYGLTSSVRLAWARECPCAWGRWLLLPADKRPRSDRRVNDVPAEVKDGNHYSFGSRGGQSKETLDDTALLPSATGPLSFDEARMHPHWAHSMSTVDSRQCASESVLGSTLNTFIPGTSSVVTPTSMFLRGSASPLADRLLGPEPELDLDSRISLDAGRPGLRQPRVEVDLDVPLDLDRRVDGHGPQGTPDSLEDLTDTFPSSSTIDS